MRTILLGLALFVAAASSRSVVRIHDGVDMLPPAPLPGVDGSLPSVVQAPLFRHTTFSDTPSVRQSFSLPALTVPVNPSAPVFQSVQISNVVPITRISNDAQNGLVDFEAGNGIKVADHTRIVQGTPTTFEGERGEMLKTDKALHKSGSYSYVSKEGTPVNMEWIADEHGFRVLSGSHIPTPPPMPALIAESLRATGYSHDYSSYSAPAVRTEYTAPIRHGGY